MSKERLGGRSGSRTRGRTPRLRRPGAYEYSPFGDSPPAAALSLDRSSGPAPLAVTADASASTDTDATPIASHSFDFGDGSPTVAAGRRDREHTAFGGGYVHRHGHRDGYRRPILSCDRPGMRREPESGRQRRLRDRPFRLEHLRLGCNVTLARVTWRPHGNWAAQLANTGTTASTCLLNDSPNWVSTTSANGCGSLGRAQTRPARSSRSGSVSTRARRSTGR